MKTKVKDKKCKYRFDEKRDPEIEGFKNREAHTLRNLCELNCYPHSDRKCISLDYNHKTCPMVKP